MKIIIPMAGRSRRFQSAGYSVPKPFILIDGKPMIHRVCRMFAPTDDFIFICQEEHAKNEEYVRILKSAAQNVEMVAIPPHEFGPVYSALQVEKFIDDENEPFILSYCDFTMQWQYKRFLHKAAQYEGAIPVFRGFHPASYGDTYYAYARTDDHDEMLELREKNSFTNNRAAEYASTGVYYFDSWKIYKRYAQELLDKKIKSGSEYYCSLIYNLLVRDGHKVCVFEAEKFICWGTPEDLAEYNFWSGFFSKQADSILQAEQSLGVIEE